MQGSHAAPLVILSLVIAVLASYTALTLAGRVAGTQGRARGAWLVGGSITMGSGIWSMHFVAMLAFRLPVQIAYDVPLVGLSLLAAVAASAFALFVASRPTVGPLRLAAAGTLMGGGIATMHYTGMAAMRMAAHLAYDWRLVALSGLIAIGASTVALWLSRRLRGDDTRRGRWRRAAAAVVLGLAIAGLHYTAMGAAHFAPARAVAGLPGGYVVATAGLAAAVVVGTLIVLALTLVGSVVDHWVRLQVASAEALRESEERYRSVVGDVHEVIFRTDAAGRWTFLNRAWTEITGFGIEESLGASYLDYVHPDDREAELAAFRSLAAGNERSVRDEVRYLTRGGGVRWIEVHARIARDGAGTLVGAAGTLRDVTQERALQEAKAALEARLVHQAFHDSLTGLANRALFRDRLEHALARAARGERLAVLLLDLDDFKAVNDSLGHVEGDRLLEAVAARLLKATRGCDTVARLGGDEFAVLLEGLAQAADVATVVERVMAAMRQPVALHGREVRVGVSIGVAHVDVGLSVEELLRNADLAMYQAKAAGKGCHAVFASAMHAAALERLELEADLRAALERHEFRLVYQPIVELETGRPVELEALLRWHHPSRGVVSPDGFVPLAEATGLIVPLGRWVLGEACRRVRRWQRETPGQGALRVSVNLSGRQLLDPALVGDVADALAASGLAPDCLTLEITESVLMHDTEATLGALRALKALGVRLAIDDFGTGYSSLSYLQRFPVDVLKIDRAFVAGLASDGSDAALAHTIVRLAGLLGLSAVAEGVERPEQRAQLVTLGCGRGQGFLFARPLDADRVEALLRAAAPAPAAPAARPRRAPAA